MAVETLPPGPGGAGLGSGRGRILSSLRSSALGVTGGILLVLVVLAAVLAPLLAPYPPTEVHFDTPFQRPLTEGFLLGTDDLGRDVLSRLLFGIQASLQVGVLSVLLAVVVGTPLGLLAGYSRGFDAVISRLTDVTLAFPFLIIAVGLAAINGASLGNAAIALGVAQVPTMIRVVRGETLRIKESDFVLGARTMDASAPWIMLRHVLPNATSAIIVQATVIMPVAVIGEALLSFLGLGIQPPTPSLGIMLSDAQQYIFRAPSAAIFPGVAIAVICLAFNLFGDALRDAFDPTHPRRK
ncbi:ABC transporter permease [Arthrobacter sp. RIT-PI-e]|uniref:ABC transporter permease n=1 Tax=Arthrobacter sp. RIT-PI-e TaxID=1681197 RepID=UPI000675BB64|nr:ABC transporter permease [Arthrobacter sp. RIT-PI-e]KNC19710.1 ABC transporter permease [Arthrobacter sp. RIT-PI-e]